MQEKRLTGVGLLRMTPTVLCLVSIQVFAGQSLQPGFYYHEPSVITLENASSGLICTDAQGQKSLCEPAIKILVTGEDTCNWPVGQQNPCTNFGYEFDYSGAKGGTHLECSRKRYNPRTGEQKDSYRRAIDGERGQVVYQSFRTYAPVDERSIFSEVHDCSYLGEKVATIEFMIYYEPEVGGEGPGDNADRYFSEVPDACSSPYLTQATAAGLLRATAARKHAIRTYSCPAKSVSVWRRWRPKRAGRLRVQVHAVGHVRRRQARTPTTGFQCIICQWRDHTGPDS